MIFKLPPCSDEQHARYAESSAWDALDLQGFRASALGLTEVRRCLVRKCSALITRRVPDPAARLAELQAERAKLDSAISTIELWLLTHKPDGQPRGK